jgi:hypothetical protein
VPEINGKRRINVKRAFVGVFSLAALVVTVCPKPAYCQEQMIISGLAGEEFVYSTGFSDLLGHPFGAVDLEDLRARCGTVQVKVAAWLASDSLSTVTLRVNYHKNDTTRVAVVDISHSGSWAKLQSNWVDLFQTVPDASTEAIGGFFLQGSLNGTVGGFGEVGGSSIILRCVPQ